jgi:hypothetical protein
VRDWQSESHLYKTNALALPIHRIEVGVDRQSGLAGSGHKYITAVATRGFSGISDPPLQRLKIVDDPFHNVRCPGFFNQPLYPLA